MFKKICLYATLFLVVAVSTAVGVVLLNPTPKVPTITPPTTPVGEPTVIGGVMEAFTSMDNYSGNFEFTSDDKNTAVYGTFAYNNKNNVVRVSVRLQGKISNFPVNLSLKFDNNIIYASLNDNGGFKIAVDDVMEIAGVAMSILMNDSAGEFSIESIVELLEPALESAVEEMHENKNTLEINLPFLNDVYMETSKEFIPTFIEAKSIEFGENKFSFKLNGTVGNTPNISITNEEKNDYFDLGTLKPLLFASLNTFSKPLEMSGTVSIIGLNFDLFLRINSRFEIFAEMTIGQLPVTLILIGDTIYLEVSGVKIRTNFDEILSFLGNGDLGDLSEFLSGIKIKDNRILIGSLGSVELAVNNGAVEGLGFDAFGVNGLFGLKVINDFTVTAQQGDYISLPELEAALKPFMEFFKEEERSFNIKGSTLGQKFDLNCYVNFVDTMNPNIYAGGEIAGIELHVWFCDGFTYLMVPSFGMNGMVKFSNQFSQDFIDYAAQIFGIEIVENILDVLMVAAKNFVLEELSYLSVSSDGTVTMTFSSHGTIIISSSDEQFFVSTSDFFITEFDGKPVSVSFEMETLTGKEFAAVKSDFDSLVPNWYRDFDKSGFGDFAKAAINTFSRAYSKFEGNLQVEAVVAGVSAFHYNIPIIFETWFDTATLKFEFKVTIKNLPSSSLFMNIPVFYDHQTVIIEYRGGNIFVTRKAPKFFSSTEVLLDAFAVAPKNLDFDAIIRILGIRPSVVTNITDMMDGKTPGMEENVSISDLITLDPLVGVDGALAANLKTSPLWKSFAAFANLTIKHNSEMITNLSLTALFGNFSSYLGLKLSLKTVY